MKKESYENVKYYEGKWVIDPKADHDIFNNIYILMTFNDEMRANPLKGKVRLMQDTEGTDLGNESLSFPKFIVKETSSIIMAPT